MEHKGTGTLYVTAAVILTHQRRLKTDPPEAKWPPSPMIRGAADVDSGETRHAQKDRHSAVNPTSPAFEYHSALESGVNVAGFRASCLA